jgi:hypothetical protein
MVNATRLLTLDGVSGLLEVNFVPMHTTQPPAPVTIIGSAISGAGGLRALSSAARCTAPSRMNALSAGHAWSWDVRGLAGPHVVWPVRTEASNVHLPGGLTQVTSSTRGSTRGMRGTEKAGRRHRHFGDGRVVTPVSRHGAQGVTLSKAGRSRALAVDIAISPCRQTISTWPQLCDYIHLGLCPDLPGV